MPVLLAMRATRAMPPTVDARSAVARDRRASSEPRRAGRGHARRMPRVVAAALAFALLAALAAACGGEAKPLTHDQYRVALDAIVSSPTLQRADREFSELAAGTPSTPCPQEARAFAEDIHELVARVAKLRPPADVADLQARFVPPARRTAELLDQLADDVAAGRVACGMSWNRRAYRLRSTMDAERVMLAYATRGYLLPWNSGD